MAIEEIKHPIVSYIYDTVGDDIRHIDFPLLYKNVDFVLIVFDMNSKLHFNEINMVNYFDFACQKIKQFEYLNEENNIQSNDRQEEDIFESKPVKT